jgi:hypothetical protein
MLSSTGGSLRAFLAIGYFNPILKFSQEPWGDLKGNEVKETYSSSLGQVLQKQGYNLGGGQFRMPFLASCFW